LKQRAIRIAAKIDAGDFDDDVLDFVQPTKEMRANARRNDLVRRRALRILRESNYGYLEE
jgi:hypothetical protein